MEGGGRGSRLHPRPSPPPCSLPCVPPDPPPSCRPRLSGLQVHGGSSSDRTRSTEQHLLAPSAGSQEPRPDPWSWQINESTNTNSRALGRSGNVGSGAETVRVWLGWGAVDNGHLRSQKEPTPQRGSSSCEFLQNLQGLQGHQEGPHQAGAGGLAGKEVFSSSTHPVLSTLPPEGQGWGPRVPGNGRRGEPQAPWVSARDPGAIVL